MRALAKHPRDRYASAAEFSTALARVTMQTRNAQPPPGARAATAQPTPAGPRGAPLGLACLLVVTTAVLSALVAAALVRGP
jgi:hypothetical protein